MMNAKISQWHRLPLFLFLISFTCPSMVRADAESDFAKLLQDKAPAVVTIKFVLKMQMPGMDDSSQESETETTGIMIDPKGTVLCSGTGLGGIAAMMRHVMGQYAEGVSATPIDLKVLVGDDTEGRAAELVARDTELDLAWVRIKDVEEATFSYIDLTVHSRANLGDRVVTVGRLGKYFGRTAVITDGRIGGVITKPRELYAPTGDISGAHGLPIFLPSGKFVGFGVLQLPDAEGEEGPGAMFSRMMGMDESMTAFILPAGDVQKATQRALAPPTGK